MRWQDIVIAIAQVCFILALIPTMTSKDKPPLITCVMNVILVVIISFCLFTLHLWLGGVTAVAIGVTWAFIAFQKFNLNKR